MTSKSTMDLNWKGPLRFGATSTPPDPKALPPGKPGVYVWTIRAGGEYLVTYVGETGNLWNRLLEHAYGLMGGNYWIYDPEKLSRGEKSDPLYKADPVTGNWAYVVQFERLGPLARENLLAAHIFWAELTAEVPIRRCVESALITAVQSSGERQVLENTKVSVGEEACPGIRIRSHFPEGAVIRAFAAEISYGRLT